jgi:hypothetical protein
MRRESVTHSSSAGTATISISTTMTSATEGPAWGNQYVVPFATFVWTQSPRMSTMCTFRKRSLEVREVSIRRSRHTSGVIRRYMTITRHIAATGVQGVATAAHTLKSVSAGTMSTGG